MTRTRTNTTQSQDKMTRYVVLLLTSIFIVFVWGLSVVYSSSSMVYEVSALEKENMRISRLVAEEESAYFSKTRMQNAGDVSYGEMNMVAFSTRDEHVRYAAVGGSVYSLVSQSDLYR